MSWSRNTAIICRCIANRRSSSGPLRPADRIPFRDRIESLLAFDGIDLDRSTLAALRGLLAASAPQIGRMASWPFIGGQVHRPAEPLADAIGRHALAGQVIFADDTPIKLQAPGTGRTKTARIWTYVRDERSWPGADPPAVWYRFTIDRKGQHPAEHLAGYRGWVHAPADVS